MTVTVTVQVVRVTLAAAPSRSEGLGPGRGKSAPPVNTKRSDRDVRPPGDRRCPETVTAGPWHTARLAVTVPQCRPPAAGHGNSDAQESEVWGPGRGK